VAHLGSTNGIVDSKPSEEAVTTTRVKADGHHLLYAQETAQGFLHRRLYAQGLPDLAPTLSLIRSSRPNPPLMGAFGGSTAKAQRDIIVSTDGHL
jgi:hypothetical protein